jgi:DNA-directed RNA polymerase specialized sigma24 family protein
LDLLSALVSTVERLRANDADEPETGRSVRCEQAPRVWRVSDRLSEAELHSLVSGYLAGITARELAEQFKISKSSVKRLLREHAQRGGTGEGVQGGSHDRRREGAHRRPHRPKAKER